MDKVSGCPATGVSVATGLYSDEKPEELYLWQNKRFRGRYDCIALYQLSIRYDDGSVNLVSKLLWRGICILKFIPEGPLYMFIVTPSNTQ